MGRLPHPVHVISAVNGRRRPLGYANPGGSVEPEPRRRTTATTGRTLQPSYGGREMFQTRRIGKKIIRSQDAHVSRYRNMLVPRRSLEWVWRLSAQDRGTRHSTGGVLCEPGSLILDITDPSRIAYCFLLPAEDSFHDEKEDPKGQARTSY